MKIGFTETQIGMSDCQKNLLRSYLLTCRYGDEFHHGDCIGSDFEAHDIAKSLNLTIHIHPPSNESKRAFKEGLVHIAKPYLERNHDIVNLVEILFAAPKTDREELRSGTWATVRFARKRKIRVVILKR